MRITKREMTGVLIDPDKGFYDALTLKYDLNRFRDVLGCENVTFPRVYLGGVVPLVVACDYNMWSKKRRASALDKDGGVFYRGPIVVFNRTSDGDIEDVTDDNKGQILEHISISLVKDKSDTYTTYTIHPLSQVQDWSEVSPVDAPDDDEE